MNKPSRLRIDIRDLPRREQAPEDPNRPKIVAREGESCYQNCDCAVGLICRANVCVSDW